MSFQKNPNCTFDGQSPSITTVIDAIRDAAASSLPWASSPSRTPSPAPTSSPPWGPWMLPLLLGGGEQRCDFARREVGNCRGEVVGRRERRYYMGARR